MLKKHCSKRPTGRLLRHLEPGLSLAAKSDEDDGVAIMDLEAAHAAERTMP